MLFFRKPATLRLIYKVVFNFRPSMHKDRANLNFNPGGCVRFLGLV